MVSKLSNDALKREARLALGVPDNTISTETDIALQCAIDMGFRDPHSVAEMARKFLKPALTTPTQTRGDQN